MKIIVPAAGQGTRLRPHTHTLPKVMLPVAGKPIIGHILSDVAALGATSVRLVVGYRGDVLAEYANRVFSELPIEIVWQREQLGLGHAVLEALDEGDEEAVLIALGDTVFDVDYQTIVASEANVLGVRPVPDPERFGIVELDAARERVVRVVEKPSEPKGNLALVGLYLVQNGERLRQAINGLVAEDTTTRGEYQLTDALQSLIDEGEIFVPYEIGAWFDCGKPETLLSTNRELLDLRGGSSGKHDLARIVPPVFVAPECTIENSIVGPHASISEGATVRDAIIRDSIVGSGAWIEGVVLEGSIIGPDTRVKSGPLTLNLGEGSEWTC